jgi:hypothetical protein
MQWINRITGLAMVGLLLVGGYFFVQWRLDEMADQKRLQAMGRRYDALQEKYNAAVRRTAVTELLVRNGTLSVRIRTVEGPVKTIRTPFDPQKEVYVDYVVVDGRFWIRRIFDSNTSPDDAMIIDSRYADVDWSQDKARYGKAVYRQLEEGRWVVSVTGNGALGLRKVPEDGRDLSPSPEMAEFESITVAPASE